MLPALPLPPSHFGVIFDHFFALFFQVCFWRHIFRTFYAAGVPRVSQIGAFWVHFEHFFVIGWISENDALARVSARFSRFQGFPKSHIFGVFLGMHFRCLFRTLFFNFLWFLIILGVPLGSIWRPFGELNGHMKVFFSPEAPRDPIREQNFDSGDPPCPKCVTKTGGF